MDLVNWGATAAPLAEGSYDFILVSRAIHGWMRVEGLTDRNFAELARSLKPGGVLAIERIASHPALGALGFGSEDYAGALGVPPEPAALMGPAQTVLTGAHAFGLPCWGLPGSIALVDDLEGLERIVRIGRAIGFTGSVCIHPRQVPVVNRGFSPSDEERAWAARVVAADAAARAGGLGAVLLDGRMIDRPIVERARRWLGTAG